MEDGESLYCMYAVLNMGYKPSEFANLPPKEKAFVVASIRIKMESQKQ